MKWTRRIDRVWIKVARTGQSGQDSVSKGGWKEEQKPDNVVGAAWTQQCEWRGTDQAVWAGWSRLVEYG